MADRSVRGPGLDVMATKLTRPRIPAAFVTRPHLDELLTTGATRALTVVSAGAGWGKTLAVANWVASKQDTLRVGWMSLDPGDNEAGRFWSCFLAALEAAGAVSPDGPLAGLLPGLGDPEDGFRRLRAGLASLPDDVVVVIDDFHLVTDAGVLGQVAQLLHHPHPRLRLCLLTRSDPALPLHRLRVADDIVEIRSRDLAFGAGAATQLLANHDVPVRADDALALVDRTEGWPAGLRLAALFLGRHGTDRSVTAFAGDDRAVSTYLAEEVLASLSPELQLFLLRTSIVERVSSSLAEVLTGQTHSQQQLEALEASNTFVVGIGPGRQWFRSHALMREMLQHRLRVDEPGVVPELHRKAAGWFSEHGYAVDALRHAADAADWDLVGQLFVDHAAPLVVTVDRSAIQTQLARIPPARLNESAALALCGGALRFLEGRFHDVQAHLDVAAALLESEPPAGTGVRVALLGLTSPAARARGDITGLIAAAHRSIEELSGPAGTLPAGPAYRAVALGNLGTGLLWSGELDQARLTLLEALAAVEVAGLEATKINVLSHLALADAVSGRVEEAWEHAAAATDLVASRGWAPMPQVAMAHVALALHHLDLDDAAAARDRLELGWASGHQEPTARWAMRLVRARMYAEHGEVQAARGELLEVPSEVTNRGDLDLLGRWRALADVEVDLAEGVPASAATRVLPVDGRPFSTQHQILLAREALQEDDARGAEAWLRAARERREPARGSLVEIWLLTAISADRVRDDARAMEALGRSLEAYRATPIRRPFLQVGPEPLVRLLHRLRVVSPGQATAVDEVLALVCPDPASPGGSAATQPLTEPPTDRELSVLQFLPSMMTNDEIAAELYVSVNTVKAHLKTLFRKLGVSSRRHAVVRGRELGLLATAEARDDAE